MLQSSVQVNVTIFVLWRYILFHIETESLTYFSSNSDLIILDTLSAK